MSRNLTIFYPGGVKAQKGVEVALRNVIVKCVTKVECYSDGLTFVKISEKPVHIVIIQV